MSLQAATIQMVSGASVPAKKSAAPTVVAGPKTTAAPADPCAVSLTAPDIAKAVTMASKVRPCRGLFW